MTLQLSTPVRNARLEAIETTISASAVLTLATGAQPATCAASEAGTVLATIQLPGDWMSGASGGSMVKIGTWSDTSADETGTAGHFRIYDATTTVCGMQGSVSLTGGGGDLTLDSVSITAGQSVTISGFTLTDANG